MAPSPQKATHASDHSVCRPYLRQQAQKSSSDVQSGSEPQCCKKAGCEATVWQLRSGGGESFGDRDEAAL